MPEHYLRVEPRDPAIFRDGRPFGVEAGFKMRSQPWGNPQTMAGTLRTLIGKDAPAAVRFREQEVGKLLSLSIHGPLGTANGELYFPLPKDLVWQGGAAERWHRIRPRVDGKTAVRRPAGLESLGYLVGAEEEFKPERPGGWVPASWMARWLTEDTAALPPLSRAARDLAQMETRTHVRIQDATGRAEDQMLFQTSGARLERGVSMAVRVQGGTAERWQKMKEYHPLGGERRLAWFEAAPEMEAMWSCPQPIRDALGGELGRVRLILATPSIFSGGWAPGWLLRKDVVPGTQGLRLELVTACVDRWIPVSGWSYEAGKRGAKAVQRMAPAGAVYFCRVAEGSAEELRNVWLRPVADEPRDRRDGYGLALWGAWSD